MLLIHWFWTSFHVFTIVFFLSVCLFVFFSYFFLFLSFLSFLFNCFFLFFFFVCTVLGRSSVFGHRHINTQKKKKKNPKRKTNLFKRKRQKKKRTELFSDIWAITFDQSQTKVQRRQIICSFSPQHSLRMIFFFFFSWKNLHPFPNIFNDLVDESNGPIVICPSFVSEKKKLVSIGDSRYDTRNRNKCSIV